MNEEDAINDLDSDKDLLDKIKGRLALPREQEYDLQSRDLLERAHEKISEAIEWEKQMKKWQKEGETYIRGMAGWSAMFHIGRWWADRPWRKR